MVYVVDGIGSTQAAARNATAEAEFQSALQKVPDPGEPSPTPKAKPNTSVQPHAQSEGSGSDPDRPNIDAQPRDDSRPDLWIEGPPGHTEGFGPAPGHKNGSDFVIPPPDDWQPNPGDVI